MKSSLTDAYKIVIENFEGPFDLLFFLIGKNEIDIYDIPISEIADQYMEYLFAMQEMDLEIASEFLVMAATLLHIKSRLLLPKIKDEQEDELDPREELIMRLVEYKKYKTFSGALKNRESIWDKSHTKLPEVMPKTIDDEIELTISALLSSYTNIIKSYKERQNDTTSKMGRILQHEKVSVKAKIKEILEKISSGIKVSFSAIFNKRSRIEIATGFLAMLELVRLNKADIEQKQDFGDIYIFTKDKDKVNKIA